MKNSEYYIQDKPSIFQGRKHFSLFFKLFSFVKTFCQIMYYITLSG